MVWHLCQPVWDAFCEAAALAEVEGFPTETELLENRRVVAPVEWQLPEQEWVDPTSEQNAAENALKSYTDTYQRVLGGRGMSYRATFYQLKKERDLRLKLGLLTPEEQTAQMMAAQTGAAGPADEAIEAEQYSGAGGEFMGMKRRDWLNIRKAVRDVQKDFIEGLSTETFARTELAMLGVPEPFVESLISDARDGSVDNVETDEVTQ
jgi:hypothetical protein